MEAIAAAAASGMEHGNAPARLVRAAHEFEAQMMKELMKPMTAATRSRTQTMTQTATRDSGGALGEFASEALGRALSEQGGFGIANRIIKDLSHSGNQSVTGKVTGNLHGDTVVKSF